MTAYRNILSQLYGLTRFGEKLNLDGPKSLLAHLENPLDGFQSVLVGGTNGKGSTSAFLETALRAHGVRTGLFSSPHLNQFTERIRIDGVPVDPCWVVDTAPPLLKWAHEQGASFFECVWGLACLAFRDFEVDIAIWEVGLGGRLDATNVADPVVSAITSIGLDHTHVLGDTLSAIAKEKSAIFRSGRPALTAATGEGLSALRAVSEVPVELVPPLPDSVPLPLPGPHQRRNANLALAMADALGYPTPVSALENTVWSGRGEIIGNVILDSAHNGHAFRALEAWLNEDDHKPFEVIMGVMEGKCLPPMVEVVSRLAEKITLVTPDYPRRVTASELAKAFERPVNCQDSVSEALDNRDLNRKTLVCGSSFLVAEARAHLLDIEYPECGLRTVAR